MADDLAAKRDQKPWQVVPQKETEGRGALRRVGSNQPKPREGRVQTAQGISGLRMTRHAATGRLLAWALATSRRICWRLNWKVRSAEAW